MTSKLDFNGDGKIGIISDATAAIAQTREAIEDNTIIVTARLISDSVAASAEALFRPANDALGNLAGVITGGLNRVGIGISRDAISFGGVKGAVFSRDVVSFGGGEGAVFSRDIVSFGGARGVVITPDRLSVGGRLGLFATNQSLTLGGIGITTDGRGFISGGGSVGGGGASASFDIERSTLTTGGLRGVGGLSVAPQLRAAQASDQFLAGRGISDPAVRGQIIAAGFDQRVLQGGDVPDTNIRFTKLFPDQFAAGKRFAGRLGNIETRVATINEAAAIERSGAEPVFESQVKLGNGRSRFLDLRAVDRDTLQPLRDIQFVREVSPGVINPREITAAADISRITGRKVEFIIVGR